jgi:methionine-rich copper-binding protein CopC
MGARRQGDFEMRFKTRVLVAAAALAVPAIWFFATVSAHATIGSVAWNDPNSPTKVVATSRGDDIRNEAGTYGLQVFDPSGRDITAGPTVLTGPKTMEVPISRPQAQGQYRVAWKTRSAEPDMHDASGNLSLQLNVVSAPAPAATTAPSSPAATTQVQPPSTGDAGLLRDGAVGVAPVAVLGASLILGAVLVVRRRVA